ncbi:hypothetical protein [Anthocerotibacter panamensis]|uniref:hypothetical protein n=1 Tax=Anthocerotibacter panamensis TaxID=2857077 RepID=UPI001C4030AD|nr:hypothetical protein [Anthocerotibacter panamensis]
MEQQEPHLEPGWRPSSIPLHIYGQLAQELNYLREQNRYLRENNQRLELQNERLALRLQELEADRTTERTAPPKARFPWGWLGFRRRARFLDPRLS